MSKDLEDFLNEELLNVKKKKEKNKKIEWKESDTKEIFEQEENKDDQEDDTDKDAEIKYKDEKDEGPEIKPKKAKHTPKGDKVMEVSLELSGQDYGTIELGSEEYSFNMEISNLLSHFNVSAEKIKNPETTTETLSLTVVETLTAERNEVQLNMGMDVDDNVGINVKVNNQRQTFKSIPSAIENFNMQYKRFIIDTIDGELG